MFCLYNPNSATISTANGSYNSNLDTITLFSATSGLILDSCAQYTSTTVGSIPDTLVYSFMPCGTNIIASSLQSTGGLSNATITCAQTNISNNKCDSQCLANCSAIVSS